MLHATKSLPAVNDEIVLDSPGGVNGTIMMQYGAGGAGTVVVEGTLNGTDWVDVLKPDGAVLSLAAAGIAWAEDPGYDKVRARKSVGVAAVTITLRRSNG